ncbi:membrane protein containing DUF1566 [Candidatus Thiomargarita nelsonii]|uniref:Membrane protein containing DUF1566 n=1 Tax=Candidatus Thiomargarita nelsonii TaxID=1003181 RepID=A0A176RWF8_9GAMM|nr:membrane protein containing DUF1566 [Candidatus Thiomargarita nelsonii]
MMTPILLGFGGFMLFVALIDVVSFFRDRHINCKSIIINIGVLGTFVGIVLGLLDFDTQNITKSVPPLLEGLKLAFLTSILGLGLSVFLSVIQALFLLLRGAKADEKVQSESKQQLDMANQSLAAILESVKHTHQALIEILETLKQLKSDIYQRRHRFSKLNAEGQALPDEATQWAAVQDNETGFIWETKTHDGGLQDGKHIYTWYADGKGKKNGGQCQGSRCDTEGYVEAINKDQIAGYDDWYLPTIEELESLFKDIDKRYFPNIQREWYCSSTPSKDDMPWCLNFETGNRGGGQGGYVLLARKNKSI